MKHMVERQPTSYFYGPIVQGRRLTHRAGGKHGDEEDLQWRFPSLAGCREELLDPPDLGSMAAVDRDVFWKVIGYLGFSRRGVFIGEEAVSEVGQGGLTTRGVGQPWGAPPCGVAALWPLSVSSSVLWKLR
jgi:hypothetical protein